MTGMLRVVIVDDEAPAREGLRLRLERESNVELIGEYSDPAAALEAIEADPPDLIFLDVQMPAMSGFDVVASTNASLLPPVVFVTAHADYAVRAFGIRALDYLLKPVEQARLHEAIERAREYWVARRGSTFGEGAKHCRKRVFTGAVSRCRAREEF
jgi:Response regulator of the LytR/AlgR family